MATCHEKHLNICKSLYPHWFSITSNLSCIAVHNRTGRFVNDARVFLGRFTTTDSEIYQRVKFIMLSVSNRGWMLGIRFIGTTLPESFSWEDDRVSELSNKQFFQIQEISVLRQEFTRHVNEKGPKKTKERRRRRFELKVSKSSRVDFIYTTQNHKSHRLGGLYKFCSVWHPLSLHPRFKWGNNSIRIKKKI